MGSENYKTAEEVAKEIANIFDPDENHCLVLKRQDVAKISGRTVAKNAYMKDVSEKLQKRGMMAQLDTDNEEITVYPEFKVKSYEDLLKDQDDDE
jgi:hypothetical protein